MPPPVGAQNVAERALRSAVLWRKGGFGSDSEAGSGLAERVLTEASAYSFSRMSSYGPKVTYWGITPVTSSQ